LRLYLPRYTMLVGQTTAIWEDLLLWDRFEIGEKVAKPEP